MTLIFLADYLNFNRLLSPISRLVVPVFVSQLCDFCEQLHLVLLLSGNVLIGFLIQIGLFLATVY